MTRPVDIGHRELVGNIIGFQREVMDGGIAISRRRPKKIGEKHAPVSIMNLTRSRGGLKPRLIS